MNNAYNNNYYVQARQHAERVVRAKMGFYWHLTAYAIVNSFLVAIYLFTSWAAGGYYYPWFLWPMVAWGVGLFFNFVAVYVFPNDPQSREEMINKELQRMGVESPPPFPVYPPSDYQKNVNSTSNNVPREPVSKN